MLEDPKDCSNTRVILAPKSKKARKSRWRFRCQRKDDIHLDYDDYDGYYGVDEFVCSIEAVGRPNECEEVYLSASVACNNVDVRLSENNERVWQIYDAKCNCGTLSATKTNNYMAKCGDYCEPNCSCKNCTMDDCACQCRGSCSCDR